MFITLTDIFTLQNTIDIIIVNYSNDIHDHIHKISNRNC